MFLSKTKHLYVNISTRPSSKLTTVLDETINEALKDSYCCLCLPKVERRPWKQFPKILLLLVNRVNYDGSRIREEFLNKIN